MWIRNEIELYPNAMIQDNLFKGIFENSPTSLILTNSEGIILEANHSALTLTGYSSPDLIYSNIENLFPRKRDNAKQGNPQSSFADILKMQKGTTEFVLQKKNGDQFLAELQLTSYDAASEQFLIWSAREIFLEQKLLFDLKERVKEQLALLRVTETLFRCNDVNAALSECVNHIRNGWQFPEYTVVRIKLNDESIFVSEAFIETNWKLVSKIQNHGIIEVYYTTEVPAHGNSIFLNEEKKLIDGLAKLLSLFLDQFHAINQLKEKETLIRKITDQIPANTYQFEIDENGTMNILFASKGLNDLIYDYKAEELIDNPTKFIYEEDRDRFTTCFKNAHRSATDLSVQYRVVIEDKILWRWLRATPEQTGNGKLIWYGSAQDITPAIDYIDVLEQIIFDISHVIRRPITTLIGLINLVENITVTEGNVMGLAEKFKIVAVELDQCTKYLNEAYNEKKLSTTEFEMRFQFLNTRIDLFSSSAG